MENVHNSMKKYIPNDQYMMLQNHARVRKIYASCKRDQRIFNVTGYENFIDKFSDTILQLTFKNPLLSFGLVDRKMTTSI